MMDKKHTFHYIAFSTAIILLTLGLFLINIPSLQNQVRNEGRSGIDILLRLPGSFRAAVESNAGLRDFFIRTKHEFQYRVLREKRYPIVLGGKDGWLYYTGERNMDDYQNAFPISDDELMQIYSNLESINRRLSIHDKLFLVVIAPNRETIYPDYLPSGTAQVGDNDRLDALMAYMEKMGGKTKILDLRDELLAARQDNPLLYFKTDTHWNQLGAFVAYQEICKAIQSSEGFEDFTCRRAEDYTIEYIPYSGDMVKLMPTHQVITELIPNFLPNFNSPVIQDPPPPYGRDRIEWVYTRIPEGQSPNPYTLVSFRDSFSMDLVPFLREDFEEATFEWNFHYNQDLINEKDPDIVIIEVVERYLHALAWFTN
ncbi:MAG: hypothetical protein HPY85_01500 [Anaerolineae bacterium]|nr:hypothetical protein [Anaerolineae bacterium]